MARAMDGEYEAAILGELEEEITGQGEGAFEDELESGLLGEDELSLEGELPRDGEQFIRRRRGGRGLGGFIRRAAPLLRSLARTAIPLVARAVGGPLAGQVADAAVQQSELGFELPESLPEDEIALEDELPEGLPEDEGLPETNLEAPVHETLPELGRDGELPESHQESQPEVMAEYLAELAAGAATELEADAMIGAAASVTLTARERRALRRLLPHLVRGVAVLTRLLRRRRITRPVVRTVPSIVRQTVQTLRQRMAAGQPVNRRLAGQLMALQTRRILGSPRVCVRTILNNLRSSARVRSSQGMFTA